MSKEIVINANLAEEVRIAILEGGRLVDLDIETAVKAKHKGNIYKGIISNIEDGLDAAFVEIGEERQAFLPLSEVRPSIFPEGLKGKKKIKISDALCRGQELVVQVTKDEIGNKGAAVSTYLSLPGRFVVLMHSDESGGGISRKIDTEAARSAARDMLSRLSVPENMAVIIRTAGMSGSKTDLFRDFRLLCETWQQIDKGAQLGRAPTLLYREPDVVIRTIRDYFSNDVARIIIDDEEEYEDVLNYFREQMPDLLPLLERHRKREPIFHYFGIEKAINDLFDLEIKLPSGGYIIIEQTEALVSIDVNSGSSTKEEDHEATVYKTNLEAADEIARQLRLRDMGGIVVIDFIDMVSRWHRRDVEQRLKDLMRNDKARVKVGRISENGILELTRQRLRQSHSLVSRIVCHHCQGTGRVRDLQGLSLAALRKIAGYLAKKRQLSKLIVRLPIEVANLLNNRKRKDLLTMCDNYEIDIDVVADEKLSDSQIEFFEERRGFAGLRAKSPARDYWEKSENQLMSHSRNKPTYADIKTELPPPSIGPAPVLIDIDENEEPSQEYPQDINEDKYLDPLSDALFADAPNEPLDKILNNILPDSVIKHESIDHNLVNNSNILEEENPDEDEKNDINATSRFNNDDNKEEKRRYPSRRRPMRPKRMSPKNPIRKNAEGFDSSQSHRSRSEDGSY